jgi:hypothetical protein
VFRDVKHGEDICTERIHKLFRRQFLDGQLLELRRSIVNEDLKVSDSLLCFLHNLFTALPLTLVGLRWGLPPHHGYPAGSVHTCGLLFQLLLLS